MTNETIVLDTPEQINAWVLASRISQCHLHMAGLQVKGLAGWLKRNIPDCNGLRTVKEMYPRLLDYCDTFGVYAPGGERCNYQVLWTPKGAGRGLYFDQGVVATVEDIEANENWAEAYNDQRLVILRTMDPVRSADTTVRMVMEP
jgi:hypothetical protein